MRFSLLNYEPYLTLLKASDLTIKVWQRKSIPVSELEESLLDKVSQRYQGENIDYINFVVKERLKELTSISRKGALRVFSHLSYASLIGHALRLLTQELVETSHIKSLQEFKLVTVHVEPNVLLVKNLIEEGLEFLIYNNDNHHRLIELFLPTKYPYIDLHVHAETSYSFSVLIETAIRNYCHLFPEILRRDGNKRERKVLPKLNAIVEYFFFTCCSDKEIPEKKIVLRATGLSLKRNYNEYVLQEFKYHEFLTYLLKKLKNFEEGNFSESNSPLTEVLILQLLNEIYSSISFSGEYKGLKQMGKNFQHPIKKAYQEKREKLFKGKEDPIISATFSHYCNDTSTSKKGACTTHCVEIRFSPEKEPLKYWHEKTKEFNVDFILHYQKLNEPEQFSDYHKLKRFLLKQWRLTRDLYIFLIRELEKERRKNYQKEEKPVFSRIVGFDAAAVEYWTPPWLYRVFFKFWKLFFKYSLRRELLLTFHAGEDFIDIATGLRYVYEAIHFLNVHRLGHAMSLGVEIEKYLYRYSRVVVSPVVYFYHLLWLHHLTTEYSELLIYREKILEELERFFLNYKLQEILDPSRENSDIWQKSPLRDISLFLNNLYENLGFFDFLYHRTFQNGRFHTIFMEAFSQEFPDISTAIHFSRVLMRIHETLESRRETERKFEALAPLLSNSFSLSREEQIEILYKIQRTLIKLVNEKGIFIESCPSSNIILYNISNFSNHPLINKRNLPITINTDNPLLVGTNIQLEFAIMEEVLPDKSILKEIIKNNELAISRNLLSHQH